MKIIVAVLVLISLCPVYVSAATDAQVSTKITQVQSGVPAGTPSAPSGMDQKGFVGEIIANIFDTSAGVRAIKNVFIVALRSLGTSLTNNVPKWNGNAFVQGSITDRSGNIGIGNTNPTQKLVVTGNSVVSGSMTAATLIGNGASITSINGANITNSTISGAKIIDNTITESDIDNAFVARNSQLLDGYDSNQNNVGNTVAVRNASGDINARLFRSEFDSTNPTVGYIMTQIDTVSNNYVRPTTPAQFRSAVTDGTYINIGSSGDQIQDGTIDTSEIQDNTLTASDIAPNSIGNSELAANSVTSGNIVNGQVTSDDITNYTITSTDIAANSITAGRIAANSINGSELNSTGNFSMNMLTLSGTPTNGNHVVTKSYVDSSGFGNAYWRDVTSSRTKNTVYTNSTGRMIQVSLRTRREFTSSSFEVRRNSSSAWVPIAGSSRDDGQVYGPTGLIIPSGHQYRYTGGTDILGWYELR